MNVLNVMKKLTMLYLLRRKIFIDDLKEREVLIKSINIFE